MLTGYISPKKRNYNFHFILKGKVAEETCNKVKENDFC